MTGRGYLNSIENIERMEGTQDRCLNRLYRIGSLVLLFFGEGLVAAIKSTVGYTCRQQGDLRSLEGK